MFKPILTMVAENIIQLQSSYFVVNEEFVNIYYTKIAYFIP